MGKIIIYYYSDSCYYSNQTKISADRLTKCNIELNPITRSDSNIAELKQKYNHNTFPIVLYYSKSSKKEYLVGGNDVFQKILEEESNIKNKIPFNKISEHITNFTTYTAGQQRLLCYLLLKNNKIIRSI